MTNVLLERMKDAIESVLWQEQAGCRKGRSCCEHIFVLRQVIEKVTALNSKLVINFIDFKKAFYCIHQPSLWNIMKCNQYYPELIQGSRCAVRIDGQLEIGSTLSQVSDRDCAITIASSIVYGLDFEDSCRRRH